MNACDACDACDACEGCEVVDFLVKKLDIDFWALPWLCVGAGFPIVIEDDSNW